jgi:hypothetical protein
MNQNVFVFFSAKDLLKGYIVFRVKKFANRHKDYLHMEIQILFVRASKINYNKLRPIHVNSNSIFIFYKEL